MQVSWFDDEMSTIPQAAQSDPARFAKRRLHANLVAAQRAGHIQFESFSLEKNRTPDGICSVLTAAAVDPDSSVSLVILDVQWLRPDTGEKIESFYEDAKTKLKGLGFDDVVGLTQMEELVVTWGPRTDLHSLAANPGNAIRQLWTKHIEPVVGISWRADLS